jgi:hypothetical protein
MAEFGNAHESIDWDNSNILEIIDRIVIVTIA